MRFFEKLNSPIVVSVVLVLFLVVDGYLLYRHQRFILDAANVSVTPPDTVPASSLTEETSTLLLEQEEPTTASETTAAAAEGTASSPAETATDESNELRVDVRVVGAPAWLRIQEDGQTVVEQGTSPGFSRRLEATQEIRIRTGNAGATWVEANGRDARPLGASGEIGTWTFT